MNCPDEGTLLLHLDDALQGEARDELRAHLESCPECRRRVEALRRREAAVSGWIEAHDPEPPPRTAYDLEGRRGSRRPRDRARWRMWAAAAAVVVAAGTLVSPVRGLLMEELLPNVRGWITEAFGDGVAGSRTAEGFVPVDRDASPATSFAFRGAELTLVFESADTRGRLAVEPAPDSMVTLWGPRAEASLRVRPGLVEVGNGAVPGGDYRLAVPATVASLRLRVPGGAERVLRVEGLETTRSVTLHPAGTGGSPSGGSLP